MPTQTFFNLPEEKKTRLLKAARKEFARTSFESTSINRIIQTAEISRGSFYMYFEDKEDLFLYLQTNAMENVQKFIILSLESSKGDLFQLFEDMFDKLCSVLNDDENFHLIRNITDYIRIVRMNNQEQKGRHKHGERFLGLLMEVSSLVDMDSLRVNSTEELKEVFLMLWGIFPSSLSPIFCGDQSQEEAKKNFLKQLDWLKYGLLKNTDPFVHCTLL